MDENESLILEDSALQPVSSRDLVSRVRDLLPPPAGTRIAPLPPSLTEQFSSATPGARSLFMPTYYADAVEVPKTWEEFRGERYSTLDSTAQKEIREQFLSSDFVKSLPGGLSDGDKEKAKAKFRSENPIVANLGVFEAIKEGFGQLSSAARADAAGRSASDLSKLVAQESQDLVVNKQLVDLDKKIDAELKEKGIDRNSWSATWTTARNLATNPSALVSLTAQNLASMSTSLAATALGGAAGGALGALPIASVPTGGASVAGGRIAGGYLGGWLAEFFPERGGEVFDRITREARESGIDISDASQVERFINSKPGGIDHFYDPAQRKALGTASVSAAANLLTVAALGSKADKATKTLQSLEQSIVKGVIDKTAAATRLAAIDAGVQASRTLASRTARGVAATSAEAVGEGASEAAGRYLADNKIDFVDATKEALAGATLGVTLPLGGALYRSIRGTEDRYNATFAGVKDLLTTPAPVDAQTETTVPASEPAVSEAPVSEPTPVPSVNEDAGRVLDALSPGLSERIRAGQELSDSELNDIQSALESTQLDEQSFNSLRDFLLNLGATDEQSPSDTTPTSVAETTSDDGNAVGDGAVAPELSVSEPTPPLEPVATSTDVVDTGTTIGEPSERSIVERDVAEAAEPDQRSGVEDEREGLILELESNQAELSDVDNARSRNLVDRLRRGEDVARIRQLAEDRGLVFSTESSVGGRLSDEVRVAIGSGNAAKALDALAVSPQTNPLIARVVTRLKEVGFDKRVGIGLVSPESLRGFSPNAVAVYDPADRFVYVSNRPGVTDSVVLHEIMHAFTLEELRAPAESRSDSANRLLEYFDVIRQHPSTSKEYGAKSVEEMVAELWSNQSFRDKVSRISTPDAPEVSLLQKIADAIVALTRTVLGLPNDSDLLAALDAEINEILRPPQTVNTPPLLSEAATRDQVEQDAIRGATTPPMSVRPETFAQSLANETTDFRTKFIDYQRPFYEFLSKYFGNPQNNAAWNQLKLGRSRRKRLDEQFARTELKRVNDAAKAFADKYNLDVTEAATILGDYAQMRHVIDANASLASSGNQTLFAAGITSQQAQDSIDARLQRYDRASLESGRMAYVDAYRSLLKKMDDARAIAPGTYAALTTQYPNYVPLRVNEDTLSSDDPWALATQEDGIFGIGMNQAVIMQMKGMRLGGDAELDNAYGTLVSRAGAVNARVAFQPFKDALLVLARSGRAGAELRVVKTNSPGPVDKKGMLAFDSAGNRYEIQVGSDTISDAIYARAVEESLVTSLPFRALNSIQSFIGRNVTRFTPVFPIVNSWIMDLRERSANVASRNYTLPGGKKIDSTKVAARMLSLATVSAPSIARAASRAIADLPPGSSNLKYFDAAKKMAELGGYSSMGQFLKRDRDSAFAELKQQYGLRSVPGKIVKLAEDWGNFWESIVPTSAFIAFKEAGMSDRQAAASVLELMDFNNKGSGKTAAYVRAVYMFANPALQGAAATYDSLQTPKGWAVLAAKVAAGLLVYQLMLMTGEDDEYGVNAVDKRPANEVGRYMVFMFGDVPVKLPVGFGIDGLAWSIAVSSMRYLRGHTSAVDAAADVVKSSAKTFSPVQVPEASLAENPLSFTLKLLTPTALTPLVEVGTNSNAFGTPVKREKFDPKDPAFAQSKARTEETWKQASKFLFDSTGGTIDMAPESIKQIWLGYTAGPIAELTKAATFDKDTKGLNTVLRDDLRAVSFLGVNRFIGGDDRFYESLYYKEIRRAEDVAKRLNFTEIDGDRRLNPVGKVAARERLMVSRGVSEPDKLLVRAYYEEAAKIAKDASSKKKELARATGDALPIHEKYADATEQRMLNYLEKVGKVKETR